MFSIQLKMIANAKAFYTFRINFPTHYLWVRMLRIVKRNPNLNKIEIFLIRIDLLKSKKYLCNIKQVILKVCVGASLPLHISLIESLWNMMVYMTSPLEIPPIPGEA